MQIKTPTFRTWRWTMVVIAAWASGLVLAVQSPPLPAQGPLVSAPVTINHSTVERHALQETRGVISVNLAAGDFNLQFNGQAIAVSHEVRGRGIADLRSVQNIQADRGMAGDVSVISVRENAFANAAGLIALNQASGIANAQANGISISIGVDAQAADVDLAQTVSLTGLPATAAGVRGIRAIRVDPSAFRHARGVVQVNQSAGVGNATANSFSLTVQTNGVKP